MANWNADDGEREAEIPGEQHPVKQVLFPNIEFYSGVIMHPTPIFLLEHIPPPLFAILKIIGINQNLAVSVGEWRIHAFHLGRLVCNVMPTRSGDTPRCCAGLCRLRDALRLALDICRRSAPMKSISQLQISNLYLYLLLHTDSRNAKAKVASLRQAPVLFVNKVVNAQTAAHKSCA